jgi:hypothetical protein
VVAIAVACDRHRVDPIHLIAGRDQRSDPQAPVSFDANHDLLRIIGVAGQQLMELTDPGKSLG